MEPEPLPDHYKALGVDPKAEVTAIKAAHRKLVLTCHPDKVKDPELKQQKQEEFHCIQRAYEVLSDEKERGRYDAEITLAAIRKNKLSSSSSSRAKSTRFDTRPTNSGSSPQYATEEFRPSGSYDDDKYHDDRDRDRARGSTRHKYDASSRGSYDTYDAYPKSGSSPRADKDSRSAKASSDRTRSHQTKTRDKEERRDRSERSRFAHVEGESSSDEKARHEAGYKRRSQEDEAQRQAADARRKAEERRSYEDGRYNTDPRARKLSTQEEEARLYQHKSRAQVEAEIRPSPARNSSRDYYGETSNHSSRRESRPEAVRRSSAQPKDRRGSSGRERDRGIPEIVEWNNDDTSRRPPPPLKQYNSSPPTIEVSRTTPQRAYTTESSSHAHHPSTSPPAFLRSQTMPMPTPIHPSAPRPAPRSSTFRETMTTDHPSIPPPQPQPNIHHIYHYPAPTPSHRTVLREPDRQRHRSPSPLTRPPMGANRHTEQPVPKLVPGGRTSRNVSPTDRRTLFGEVPGANYARPRVPVRQGSYGAADVNYAKAYGPEDVRWAPRGRENEREREREFVKPGLVRSATVATY